MKNREVDRIIDEAMKSREKILTEMAENDPEIANAQTPETFEEDLFAKIREYKKEQDKKLSPEQEELIRLGTIYKRRKKWNKFVILVAAIVCLLALGITSVGGPKRVLEEFKRTIGGREQTYVNNDEKRGMEIDSVDEAEAYEEIEEKFGVTPTRLFYVPDGIEFMEVAIDEETQNARLIFSDRGEKVVTYSIMFNYRSASIGSDIEDTKESLEQITVKGNLITLKEYQIDKSDEVRWRAEFQHNNMYCTLLISGVNQVEVKKIVENLYFF